MSPGYTEPEDMQPDVADIIEYLRTRIATLEAEQDKARRVIEGLNQTVIGTLQERNEARAHIENGDAFRDAVKLACDERLQESKHEIRRLTAERDEANLAHDIAMARAIEAEAERDEAVRQHRQTLEAYRNCVASRDEARAKLARAMQPDSVFTDLLQERTRCDEWKIQANYWESVAKAARAQAFAECEEIAREAANAHDLGGEIWIASKIADAISARATLGTGEK